MAIRNNTDLKTAYEMLLFWEQTIKELGFGNEEKAKEHVKDLKREIRGYVHQESDRRLVRNDYDGAIELIEFPEYIVSKKEAEEWFEDYEYIPMRYTAYDCSGYAFTAWHYCFERHDRWYCYHSIGVDV